MKPIELTGADCFLRAFDHQVRRMNGSSHLSQLVLRLGPGFDVDGFRELLAAAARANRILRAPIRRPWRVLPPVYRTDLADDRPLPPVRVAEAALPPGESSLTPESPIPERLFDALNGLRDGSRGDLLHADVVVYDRGKQGADVALTWLHMLLDGAGSEHFITYLDQCYRGERELGELPENELGPVEADARGQHAPDTLRERGQKARAWQLRMESFAAHPPRSLAGPARRVEQSLRYALYTLSEAETQTASGRAVEKAGFLTPMLFYLAASIRAHRAVFAARGVDPGSFVVPLPVNVRPKGAAGAIFRTRVSMLWFQVQTAATADLDGTIDALKAQRRELIKQGSIGQGLAAMDFARHAPSPLYAAMARRTFSGELCSFFFAYTGEFLPGLQSFLGGEILNGFHAPSVPQSPGSGAIMSIRSGRLNVAHVHQQGVFEAGELELLRSALVRDLLGDGS